MYQSQIATHLKEKIEKEMSDFKSQNNLMSLDEQIQNAKSKDDLINIRQQLNELQKEKTNTISFQKKKILKQAGFVNVMSILIITVFICVLGICTGYLLFRFGVQ